MTTHHSTMHPHPARRAHSLTIAEPLRWLELGFQDFRKAPGVGIAYGLMVTLMGWLIFALGDHPYFIAAAVSGFLLMGPIIGAGLVESSRAIHRGGTPTFDSSLRGLNRNHAALQRFAVSLLVIALAWLALSTAILTTALGPIAPNIESALWDSALQFMSSGQLLAWIVIGGTLAVIGFSVSVIAVPLMLDQQASAGDAMRGSLRAVFRHPLVSAVWALWIVFFTAIGFVTALLGLIVIYPVLGHATWHAYRALRR